MFHGLLKNIELRMLLFLLCIAFCCRQSPGYGLAERVCLIGIDDIPEEGQAMAEMPHLKQMLSEGAYTWNAIGIHSAGKSPVWASILCSAGPEHHTVDSDDWTITQRKREPTDKDVDNYFPNIFYLIHQKIPHSQSGMFYDWPNLINLVNLHYLQVFVPLADIDALTKIAMAFLTNEKPSLTFVYFGVVEKARAQFGHNSSQYLDALRRVDEKLGEMMATATMPPGSRPIYFILIGSISQTRPAAREAGFAHPSFLWLAHGPGIRRNHPIQSEVHIYDAAATIAHLFGLPQPPSWRGKPVMEAFVVGHE